MHILKCLLNLKRYFSNLKSRLQKDRIGLTKKKQHKKRLQNSNMLGYQNCFDNVVLMSFLVCVYFRVTCVPTLMNGL